MALPHHRHRRRPGDPEGGLGFTGKALMFFLTVSLTWGLFVFMHITDPTTIVMEAGGAAAKDISLLKAELDAATAQLLAAAVPNVDLSPPKYHHHHELQLGGGSKGPKVTWNEVEDDPRFFLVYSTDCSGYQNWQSMALIFSADEVRQPGTLVRIASGCSEVRRMI